MARIVSGTAEETAEDAVGRISSFLANKYPHQSPAESLASLPHAERMQWLDTLSESEQAALEYEFRFWARPKQREPKVPYKILVLLAGRGFGKALESTTCIPTPDGFTEIGKLSIGDIVFDENGIQCHVTGVYPQGKRDIFRVKFSDNSYLDADKEHLWAVWDRNTYCRFRGRNGVKKLPDNWVAWNEHRSHNANTNIKTTADLMTDSRAGCSHNYMIPSTRCIEYAESDLPIDPYILGYMLGDGNTCDGSTAACDPRDKKFLVDEFRRLGLTVNPREKDPYHFYASGIRNIWISLGLSTGKFIPDTYMRSSVAQRRSLLQGLIDSDGSVECKKGTYSFSNTNKQLIDAMHTILCSIGLVSRIEYKKPRQQKKSGNLCKESWRIRVVSNTPLSRLPRKLDNAKHIWPIGKFMRYVENIEYIGSKDATCISVDSPNAMFLAGKSFIPTHNTRTASEIVRGWVESGKRKHIALVGANAADIRDTMVEAIYKQGSGIMQVCPPWNMPHFSPTKKTIVWTNPNYPSYGAVCSLYSGEEPGGLRGPSHDGAWVDEICKMKYATTVMDMLKFTLRRGDNPQTIISTTPKPVPYLIDLLKMAQESERDGTHDVIVIKGSTYENKANLSSSFITDINQMYEGTSLGRQEIHADLVLDAEGALWSMSMIDDTRIRMGHDGIIHLPTFDRTIIAVDPQTGYKIDTEKSMQSRSGHTMTGIVAAATSMHVRGLPRHAYVLGDYSINGKPEQWALAAITAYKLHDASIIVCEQNQGGKMIEAVIRSVDPHVPVKLITATIKKHERAIPVAAKYQQGRVHHIGIFGDLESEMLYYSPGDEENKKSPNRMDALVHAIRYLLVDGMTAGAGIAINRRI